MPTAASIRATAAGCLIQAPPGVSETNCPCYARYAPPVLGLLGDEHVVRDGFVGRPMVMSGVEIGGVNEKEIVLRGGRFGKPYILFGLAVIHNMKFIKRQKINPLLARFLTGDSTNHPLQHATIFETMRDRMRTYCVEYLDKIQSLIDDPGATADPPIMCSMLS